MRSAPCDHGGEPRRRNRTAEDALAAGSDALRHGEWKEARDHFQAALAAEETGPAWEGLGGAGW